MPVATFRLRFVRSVLHNLFRVESILNTILFAGFPGYVDKLWIGPDENGTYRGVYAWDGPARAEPYARCLWHVLVLVSVRGSIGYAVAPNVRPRHEALEDPQILERTVLADRFRLIAVG